MNDDTLQDVGVKLELVKFGTLFSSSLFNVGLNYGGCSLLHLCQRL
jgi:hypothetical protein